LAAARNSAAKYPRVIVGTVPHPRPALRSDAPPEAPIDLSRAMPAARLNALPPSARQLGALKEELAKTRPVVAEAKSQSESLAGQARDLRQKLVDTAARIEELEREKIALGYAVQDLQAQDAALTQSFARDRISVTRLLAILERLQHDMPPALAVRPDDALAAARGAMLVGDTLPPLYQKAAALAARLDRLKATRLALLARRTQAAANAEALAKARIQITQLSEEKDRQAAGAADRYGDLKTRLARIAAQAADFQALVTRVAELRRKDPDNAEPSVVTVTMAGQDRLGPLTRGSLLRPVVGTMVPAPELGESVKNPGVTFATAAGAQVIAPADGKVLFAGPYHKSGQVLILEISTGYDLVLAGLGRVSVRPNDELLAGEPVGTMPDSSAESAERLYFELREHGRGLDPAPWLNVELRKAKKT
jgi:septal ring factor EnvC (AmiA/AmiB activator)